MANYFDWVLLKWCIYKGRRYSLKFIPISKFSCLQLLSRLLTSHDIDQSWLILNLYFLYKRSLFLSRTITCLPLSNSKHTEQIRKSKVSGSVSFQMTQWKITHRWVSIKDQSFCCKHDNIVTLSHNHISLTRFSNYLGCYRNTCVK